MEVVIVIVAAICFVAFRQWLQHSRRTLIHRERLAAIEKGIELPPLEQEVRQNSWNVQRILLLAGLVWISIGISIFVTVSATLAQPASPNFGPTQGMQWIGLAPLCIGVSHLIVYAIGKSKER